VAFLVRNPGLSDLLQLAHSARRTALMHDKKRGRMMDAKILALYRYPVKGFSPEPLERAEIQAGGTMPFDRAYAIEYGPSGFDPAAPGYFPKAYFLMLMKNERMAEFRTRFDDASGIFRIFRDGALLVEASLRTAEGRASIEAWVGENFRRELRGAPRILTAPGHSFSDVSAKVLHLVNLASVHALEEKFGRPVDPLRFRPNVVIEGAPAFSELDWMEKEVRLPGLTLVGQKRTGRCAATNVDPKTGRRDMQIPRSLVAEYGHEDFGIYLVAKTSGTIEVGDTIEVDA
jgi:uncharacterized protein YcbX